MSTLQQQCVTTQKRCGISHNEEWFFPGLYLLDKTRQARRVNGGNDDSNGRDDMHGMLQDSFRVSNLVSMDADKSYEIDIDDSHLIRPIRGDTIHVEHRIVSQARIKEMQERAGIDAEGNPNPITDEHYYEVMPRDKHGWVMGMGPGVLPSKYYGSRSSYSRGNTSNEIELLKQDLERKL